MRPNHSSKLLNAEIAIETLFADTTVNQFKTCESLQKLRDKCQELIDVINEEVGEE